MKTVTAVQALTRDRVAVELDGRAWRTLPLEAVVHARLVVGSPLDRPRARRLARELRRLRALRTATSALERRDRSAAELDARLRERRVPDRERERTLELLGRAGVLDDARFARERARVLAERGAGNALISDDLARRGLAPAAIEGALAALAPERERAESVVARRGGGVKTARYLASSGFDEDVVATVVAQEDGVALG